LAKSRLGQERITMVDLAFAVEGIEVERYAAAPALLFKLRVAASPRDVAIQNVMLQCQLRIDASRRRYSQGEHAPLIELFGETHRWSETLHSMLWTHASAQISAFKGERIADLPVPCSFDFNIAATKYFYGLDGGEVPLTLLFSGTVFYRDEDGLLQMEQIPWSKETACRLPVSLWREMMDVYYPASAWLRIDRTAFDALQRYRRRRGFTSWEQALAALLDGQREESRR
jgi:hypothetical protein